MTSVVIVGCDSTPRPSQQFGLNAMYLQLDTSDLSKIQLGTFSKTKVPVHIHWDDSSFLGKLSVAGESSVDDLKKSYNLDFSNEYQGRTRYRLNAMSRDPSALRSALSFRVFASFGFATPPLQYVSVFLNDRYLGLYLFHSVVDHAFFSNRDQTAISLYAARGTDATMEKSGDTEHSFSRRRGNYGDLKQLVTIVRAPPTPANRQDLQQYLNIDSALRYMAVTAFIDNQDGIDNNFILVRTERESRFSLLPWDLDFTFRNRYHLDATPLFAKNAMMRRLYNNDQFRAQFDCFVDELNQSVPASLLTVWLDENHNQILQAYKNDRILGSHSKPLADQVQRIKDQIKETEKTIQDNILCL